MIEPLDGGVCATPGITAAGVTAGLKRSGKPDLALVAAPRTVPAAAVQTTNQVKAAPVTLTATHLADGHARAVLLNAGSANACTGDEGDRIAAAAARTAAEALGCDPTDIAVCSTGVIGVLPDEAAYLGGIPKAAAALDPDGGAAAARAIMTTDLVPKEAAARVRDDAGTAVIGGMAKGSGMIAPSLATMLAVITTDAPLAGPVLRGALQQAVHTTFNRITVDGATSTNDAVLLLATGTAERPPTLGSFTAGLTAVCADLAEQIVRDGEGATRLLRTTVRGARSEDDALAVARRVAGDLLVKTALFGGDPNWGRVLAAAGAAPVALDPRRISITFGGITVCRFGVAAHFDRGQAAAALAKDDVSLIVDLGAGSAAATVLTCDLSYDYVRINAEYTT